MDFMRKVDQPKPFPELCLGDDLDRTLSDRILGGQVDDLVQALVTCQGKRLLPNDD